MKEYSSKCPFEAKLHISLSNGYTRIERLDFKSYNEAEDIYRAVEHYRDAMDIILYLLRFCSTLNSH